jgi:hypothetical protein
VRSCLATLLVALTFPTFPDTVWTSAAAQVSSCRPSPSQNLLPDVVGPMTGASPAWLVDGSYNWSSADEPMKTLWVLLRTSESVRIVGRRVGAPEWVRFGRGADMPADVLVISNPIRDTAIPGGARPEVMRSYVVSAIARLLSESGLLGVFGSHWAGRNAHHS